MLAVARTTDLQMVPEGHTAPSWLLTSRYDGRVTLAQIASIAFAAGFFVTITVFTIRVWRRVGYCPLTAFTKGRPSEMLQVLVIWSIPPAMISAAWRPFHPSFRPIAELDRIEIR